MPSIELFTGSSRDLDNEAANTARLVNCYREPVQAGGRTRYAIKSALGLRSYASVPAVMMHAMSEVNGSIYVAVGEGLYRVAGEGAGSLLAALPDDGNASIAGNTGKVCVVSDGRYFVWTGSALTEPTPGAFDVFGSVEFLGGYTILTEKDGRRFQWSALANPASLDALDFASAESTDAPIIRAFVVNDVLRLYKAEGVEFWQRTGLATTEAFEQINGGQRDVGLKAFGLICRIPDGAFFVGSDGRAYVTGGLEQQPVSVPAVETAIEYATPRRCIFWQDEGHAMAAIVFEDGPSWVYDLATGEWHERSGADGGPWRAAATVKFAGRWLCGRDDGQIASFARVNEDLGVSLIRTARSRPVMFQDDGASVSEMEFFARIGVTRDRGFELLEGDGDATALETGFGTTLLGTQADRTPGFTVRVSRDGGFTWHRQRYLTFGGVGEYMHRLRLHALGQFRRPMVVEVVMASPSETPLYADADVRVA